LEVSFQLVWVVVISRRAFLYFEPYVVVDPGDTPVEEREVIKDETRFREFDAQYRPGGFKAMMGAEAIKELLKRVEIAELSIELRERMTAHPECEYKPGEEQHPTQRQQQQNPMQEKQRLKP